MKLSLALLLSLNAGFVDTAGFIALHGLFTAHVTGNFVTLGAAIVFGTSGTVGKLLALPVFCLVVVAARLLRYWLIPRNLLVMKTLLLLQFLLLTIGSGILIAMGPFSDPDTALAVFAGMVLVAAMAIQNAVHRVHLASAPPSTLMTGTTTQVMLDLADKLHGVPEDQRAALNARLSRMTTTVCVFAAGCAAAATFFAFAGVWCFIVPPIVGLVALLVHDPAAT